MRFLLSSILILSWCLGYSLPHKDSFSALTLDSASVLKSFPMTKSSGMESYFLSGIIRWGHPLVTIPENQQWNLAPGTIMLFPANGRLVVQGQLRAIGSEKAPIIFGSLSPSVAWGGISFYGMGKIAKGKYLPQVLINIFQHVIIEDQGTNEKLPAVEIYSSPLVIYRSKMSAMFDLKQAQLAVLDSLIVSDQSFAIRGNHSQISLKDSKVATLSNLQSSAVTIDNSLLVAIGSELISASTGIHVQDSEAMIYNSNINSRISAVDYENSQLIVHDSTLMAKENIMVARGEGTLNILNTSISGKVTMSVPQKVSVVNSSGWQRSFYLKRYFSLERAKSDDEVKQLGQIDQWVSGQSILPKKTILTQDSAATLPQILERIVEFADKSGQRSRLIAELKNNKLGFSYQDKEIEICIVNGEATLLYQSDKDTFFSRAISPELFTKKKCRPDMRKGFFSEASLDLDKIKKILDH